MQMSMPVTCSVTGIECEVQFKSQHLRSHWIVLSWTLSSLAVLSLELRQAVSPQWHDLVLRVVLASQMIDLNMSVMTVISDLGMALEMMNAQKLEVCGPGF